MHTHTYLHVQCTQTHTHIPPHANIMRSHINGDNTKQTREQAEEKRRRRRKNNMIRLTKKKTHTECSVLHVWCSVCMLCVCLYARIGIRIPNTYNLSSISCDLLTKTLWLNTNTCIHMGSYSLSFLAIYSCTVFYSIRFDSIVG